MLTRNFPALTFSHGDDGKTHLYPLGTDGPRCCDSSHNEREEQRSDFGWLTDFELEVICPASDYLVFTIPVLITPISLSNPCVTSRKNCKHVRLLFPANSPGDQCQARLCLKTSLALATRDGDRVTFLVNRQLDFHLGARWILLLLLFWTEG